MLTHMQLKAARHGMGWGVRDLAKAAGVTPNTISRLESGGGRIDTLERIRKVFEDAGVEFPDRRTVRFPEPKPDDNE
jgi:transcriptional regulator with XRE-family HTH domain